MNTPAPIRRALPADATVTRWPAPDGWLLRRFDWPGSGPGGILFQTGRGDVFEKYLETFEHWHRAGWSVTAFDWRGQGGSGRLAPDPHVGHADDFAPFIADLAAVWQQWNVAGPRVAMGHSMGGHLVLKAMLDRAINPDAAVLIAPMVGLKAPVGPRIGEALARIMRGLGDPARAAWKGNERPATRWKRQQLLTNDVSRYADEQWWYEQVPEIRLGPPSWSWLVQAFASTREQRSDSRLATLATPILMLVADEDGLVDSRAAVELARRLPNAELHQFGRESAHEILREADPVRDRALAVIDRFLATRLP
ncbi:alpha/beta fold hydrolase [Sphingomonas mucosissima]|uniref:Lysophospholipase L2 n=1 Tax=Sphingomonas mucosissima TaxID=370959 RepID=A0A245ZEX6_9SPHN|nr:alpha/beta hydrolase [Sphingomonas mucosissima]OWK28291.1 lysophospholipase L2 [Sphingomonas mucosissima]